MSEILNESIAYVEQSKVGLLITVGEDNSPYIRNIGAFSNDGANIYFVTKKESNKVKHIKQNPIVTFYFQNEGQSYDTFKSVAVTGEASEVLAGQEFNSAVEGISNRYPIIKEQISNGEFKDSSIYKVKAKFVKLADYTRDSKEIKETI
ncbi:pyridoxamine 5'-phosphate oxidase family protein [Clostridium sp. WILCCON 0269]|uniref:Pyridoxamine 5'-phosphate oxidase family protein n=1 Tax=Candidatus Clostridium eludens TaxID=3381663 RepID=A0ABW8SLD2_9CLOT